MQQIAMHCNTPQRTATHCIMPQHTAQHCTEVTILHHRSGAAPESAMSYLNSGEFCTLPPFFLFCFFSAVWGESENLRPKGDRVDFWAI